MSASSKLDLYSGMPYWLVLNGLLGDYPQLQQPLPNEDIVIIGAGISGAFIAHELCTAGFRCTMLDRRLLSSGSTCASTAHLNYELDCSMSDLKKRFDEATAVAIYESSIAAIDGVRDLLNAAGVDASYETTPGLYLASNKKGARSIKEEYIFRKQHGIPTELLDRDTLIKEYGIDRPNAIRHNKAAQLDPYRAAAGIINHHAATGALKVYTRTEVTKMKSEKSRVSLMTRNGLKINARHVVCAPGYESMQFLSKRIVNINSTYVIATQPLPTETLWKDNALIWETARPYCYLRTTAESRILIGGGDEPFSDERRRDALIRTKKEYLLKQCAKLFPHLQATTADFTWCGSFGDTKDGLPYIGEYPGLKGISFALGYGGNGTTFSLLAAWIIRNCLLGIKDPRAALFAFGRG